MQQCGLPAMGNPPEVQDAKARPHFSWLGCLEEVTTARQASIRHSFRVKDPSMDSTRPSTVSPRHTLSGDGDTSSQTHALTQMPPDVGVRPVNANTAFWRDVLLAGAAIGDVGIVGSVLSAGLASPDSSDPHSGDTALLHAAQHGKAAMVQYLLDARATADHTNNDCLTAMGLATIAGQSQVVSTLERNGRCCLSSRDGNRQYTFEQELRIQQEEVALHNAMRKNQNATKPAFVQPPASNMHDTNDTAPAERHGEGETSRTPQQASQATAED